MADKNSKLDIFNEQIIEAARHSSERFERDADALLRRILSCDHCTLDFMTIDAIEPIPADILEDEMEQISKGAAVGRLFVTWNMPSEESPDRAVYQAMCVIPYKCWEDFWGQIRLRHEAPRSAKMVALLHNCPPHILRDEQPCFEAWDDGSPIKTFELDWDMFEKFDPVAEQDYSRLEIVLTLLRESSNSEALSMMLDKNCCPERYKLINDFCGHKTEHQIFMEELLQAIAEVDAKMAAEAEAGADKASAESKDGEDGNTPDEGRAQD